MKVIHGVLTILFFTCPPSLAQCPNDDAPSALQCRKRFYVDFHKAMQNSVVGMQSLYSQFEVEYQSPAPDTAGLTLSAFPDPGDHKYYEPFLTVFEYEAVVKQGQPEGKMAYESWRRFQNEADGHAALRTDGRIDGSNPLQVRAGMRWRDYLNHYRFRLVAVEGSPIEIHFKGTSDTLDLPGATQAFRFVKDKTFTDRFADDGAEAFHIDETLLLMGPWNTVITESEVYPGYRCFKAIPGKPSDLRCCVRVLLQCHPSLADRLLNKTDFTPLWSFLRGKS